MKHYNVTGMSCAACSARVEKAVSSLPDVTACAVNLLTHSMSVEGSVSAAEVIGAVEKAGYGASEVGVDTSSKNSGADALEDRETPALRKRLVASLAFLAVLMYFSMGHMMWNWPLPRKSGGDGTCAASSDRHGHGHKSAFFRERIQRYNSPFA